MPAFFRISGFYAPLRLSGGRRISGFQDGSWVGQTGTQNPGFQDFMLGVCRKIVKSFLHFAENLSF